MEAKRQAECKLQSELMEDELLQWRQEVDTYQRHSMNKAEETAQVLTCTRLNPFIDILFKRVKLIIVFR